MSTEKKTTDDGKRVQDELLDSAHKIFLAGLGAFAVAEEEGSKMLKSAEESGRNFFKSLVERGEAWEKANRDRVDEVKKEVGEAGERARQEAESTWSRIEDRIDRAIAGTLEKTGVPSREEIATLTKRVEELTKLVEQLKKQQKQQA